MTPRDSLEGAQATVRLGIIGCGSIGIGVHLPLLSGIPGARVVAVADPSAEALRRAAAIASVATLSQADELLAREDVDAVVVCAPTERHAALAAAVASAGKHLYLEKPLGLRVEEGTRALAAVEDSGITAAIGFNYRFHPDVRRVRSLLREGAVGNVRRVSTRLWEPAPSWRTAPWREHRATGGGALLDLGSHHVDLLRWLLSDEIVEATATIRSRRTEHDIVHARFRMAGGVVCESSFSYRSGRADALVIAGDAGELRLDRYAGSFELAPAARSARPRWGSPGNALAAWVRVFRPRLDPSYDLALRAFVERLQGRPRELPTLTDGLRCLQAVVAAEDAAASAL